MAKLTQEQIAIRIGGLKGWRYNDRDRTIFKTFTFPSFVEAIAFVNRVAELAENADHHPDMDIRYKNISLYLSTHDEGGITGKDFSLAQRIETIR
jgi:4a-hydroxytetrahydrobiopterin dehydratase